jgi:anti-sigma factor RsiW
MTDPYPDHGRLAVLNCDELVERATDYLEDALSSEHRTRMDDHLRTCYGCERYLGGMRVTLRLLSGLPAPPLPGALESRLLAAFHAFRTGAAGAGG